MADKVNMVKRKGVYTVLPGCIDVLEEESDILVTDGEDIVTLIPLKINEATITT